MSIYGSSYYSIVDGPTWSQASLNAVGIGGTLAVVNDQNENQYIVDTFKNNSDLVTQGNGGNVAWIGVTYDDSRNVFINALGQDQSYFNWYPSWFNSSIHPRGSSFGDVNTTILFSSPYDGRWDDSWENQNVPYYRKGIAETPLSYFSISDASINEGAGGNVTITRTGGTSTSQTLQVQSSDSSATTSDSDYTSINTTISFAAGETSKTIVVSTTPDLKIEGNENINLVISAGGSDVVPPQFTDNTATITIVDQPPTYTFSQSTTTLNEGQSSTTTINTTNVPSGTYLYYEIIGNGIDQADFSTQLIGDIVINSSGTGELVSTTILDQITEGSEYFNIRFFTDANRTNLVNTSPTITISDISTAPIPTYTIASSSSTINEGETLTTTVSTTDVSSGTILYWIVSGNNVNNNDFSSGLLTGSNSVDSSGRFTLLHSLSEDVFTEGDESFVFKIYADANSNSPLATSSTISILDTSANNKTATPATITSTTQQTTPAPNPTLIPKLQSIDEITIQNQVTTFQLTKSIRLQNQQVEMLISGTDKKDKITGTSKGEILSGGKGKDVLKGGDGADGFLFQNPDFGKKKADKIKDFSYVEGDSIIIDNKTFEVGKKVRLQSVSGKKALKKAFASNKDFVYDERKGFLYFNENGKEKGWGDGGLFVKLQGAPEIDQSDFTIL